MKNCRYTDEVVLFMRLQFDPKNGVDSRRLAQLYGGNPHSINKILRGVHYKHVPGALGTAFAHRRRFTPEDVIAFRHAYKTGKTNIFALAREHGGSTSAMHRLLTGLSYKRVPGAVDAFDLPPERVAQVRREYAQGRSLDSIALNMFGMRSTYALKPLVKDVKRIADFYDVDSRVDRAATERRVAMEAAE
jgi:transposase-like protein